jgi:hypothetical protein
MEKEIRNLEETVFGVGGKGGLCDRMTTVENNNINIREKMNEIETVQKEQGKDVINITSLFHEHNTMQKQRSEDEKVYQEKDERRQRKWNFIFAGIGLVISIILFLDKIQILEKT